MALTKTVVNRLGGGEEACIFWRLDLEYIDDRHETARSQDRSRTIGLRFWRDPVVSSGGEHGVSFTGLDLDDLEVTDADS